MTPLASRLLQIIGALVMVLSLAGCSAVKLGYNNLPELAWWWLDGYLDFTDAQRPPVREALGRLHQWHRSQELPRYVALLAQAEQLVQSDVTPQQLCRLGDEARIRFLALADQAEEPIVSLGATLTSGQIDHLERRYERNAREMRKDWLEASPAQRRERLFDQFVSRMEDAYGTLEEPQRAVLRLRVEASPFDPVQMLAETRRRQEDTLQTLRQLRAPGLAPAQARRLVKGLVERAQFSPDPQSRAYRDTVTDSNCALVAAVHNATTPKQRQSAARRLRAYQRDLSELAAQR